MRGCHDGTIWISNGDWIASALFVKYRKVDSQKCVGTTSFSYGDAILDGGTRVENMWSFILYVR